MTSTCGQFDLKLKNSTIHVIKLALLPKNLFTPTSPKCAPLYNIGHYYCIDDFELEHVSRATFMGVTFNQTLS